MSGIERIANERQRQIDAEGWTPEHDDQYQNNELECAAECYLWAAYEAKIDEVSSLSPPDWPWHASWWKPSDDPIRNLEKAGALIAAEIDRLERERARST